MSIDQSDQPAGPLSGIVVLDLARVVAGPYCTQLLGDLGAEVLKIERPGAGDDTRAWGPPFVAGESAYYLALNRNKRSLALDLKTFEGQQIARKLAIRADIMVENFLPGTLERLGIDSASLRALNPGLITCTISGFGAGGPARELPGYDFLIQAMAGLMSVTGPAEGEPSKVGVAVVDLTTGMLAASALLAALYARERGGGGQHIDISLFECQLAWLANVASAYLLTGQQPERFGNAHPAIVPYQLFQTQDGYLALAVGTDEQWRRLCRALDAPALGDDPRYASNAQRVAQRDQLVALLQQLLLQAPTAHWIERIAAAGVPVGPLRSIPEVFADPQVAARAMVERMAHPSIGDLPLVGVPFKLSQTPASIRLPPPLLGEHSAEILASVLGFDSDTIDRLRDEGVIG